MQVSEAVLQQGKFKVLEHQPYAASVSGLVVLCDEMGCLALDSLVSPCPVSSRGPTLLLHTQEWISLEQYTPGICTLGDSFEDFGTGTPVLIQLCRRALLQMLEICDDHFRSIPIEYLPRVLWNLNMLVLFWAVNIIVKTFFCFDTITTTSTQ